MKKAIFALHGFLGVPTDWNFLDKLGIEVIKVDYMNIRGLTPDSPLERWGENFNLWVEKNYPGYERHLLGYSMGGRLAMQSLANKQKNWKSATFISSNFGLIEEQQKNIRIQEDQRWAQKFLTYEFSTVVREWNSQSVFINSQQEPVRNEKDYQEQLLAKCLTHWSLGNQKYFFEELVQINIPQLWLAGLSDSKYVDLIRKLEGQSPLIQTRVVKDASHRVIFDQPEAVLKEIQRIIS
jgi:2-succinyl-6-hydroxy-2,4-cyclohexadiene-1-carboxylate synthase